MKNREGRKSRLGWGPSAKSSSPPDGLCERGAAKEPPPGAGLGSRTLKEKKVLVVKEEQTGYP